jgi:hypothetical protein
MMCGRIPLPKNNNNDNERKQKYPANGWMITDQQIGYAGGFEE